MEKFYVTKKILANGHKWSDILGSEKVTKSFDSETCSPNYFKYSAVRLAWTEMEKHFCAETVMEMIAALNTVFADDFVPEVETEEINRVVVRFTNKYLKGMPRDYVTVEYVFCGDFLESELVYSED